MMMRRMCTTSMTIGINTMTKKKNTFYVSVEIFQLDVSSFILVKA